MTKNTNYGIDYGFGSTNVDHENGIRYGVIPANDLSCWAFEAFEADYGEPCCPKCGNEVIDYDDEQHDGFRCPGCSGLLDTSSGPDGEFLHYWCPDCETNVPEGDEIEYTGRGCADYACEDCHRYYDSGDCYGEEPREWILDDENYTASQGGNDTDVFIIRSPYYTHAHFCRPCAPGACYLRSPVDTDGPRCYCFGHDWFEDGVAPYPVYRVSDGTLVEPKSK